MSKAEAKQTAAKRNAAGQFLKGISGNPAGRPATPAEVRKAAACHMLKAIEVLANVLHDETANASMRFRAAQAIIRVARPDDGADKAMVHELQWRIDAELQRIHAPKNLHRVRD